MKALSLSRCALSVCTVAVLLAGCGGSQTGAAPLLHGYALGSGVVGSAPQQTLVPILNSSSQQKAQSQLFVSVGGSYADNSSVEIFSVPEYQHVGHITTGVSSPQGLWVDKSGNLYVANAGFDVTEYAPGKPRRLICTYAPRGSANLRPYSVTTDDENHVYVSATSFGKFGVPFSYLNIYDQCGKVLRVTKIGVVAAVGGVAVDAAGDIFVSITDSGRHGGFVEFVQGGSKPIYLGAVIGAPKRGLPGGVIVDKNRNLIATDGRQGIYRIPPPYDKAKILYRGFGHPLNVSLNRAETLLYAAYASSHTVAIFKYPSGALLKRLHIYPTNPGPNGVAAAPDATF